VADGPSFAPAKGGVAIERRRLYSFFAPHGAFRFVPPQRTAPDGSPIALAAAGAWSTLSWPCLGRKTRVIALIAVPTDHSARYYVGGMMRTNAPSVPSLPPSPRTRGKRECLPRRADPTLMKKKIPNEPICRQCFTSSGVARSQCAATPQRGRLCVKAKPGGRPSRKAMNKGERHLRW